MIRCFPVIAILLLVSLFSCRKDQDTPKGLFTIDSVKLERFDDVYVYATFRGDLKNGKIFASGVHWGDSPDSPAIYKNVETTFGTSFRVKLKKVGECKTIYCQAFIAIDTNSQAGPDLVYETEIRPVATGGLLNYWTKEYTNISCNEILKVLPATDNRFTVLSSKFMANDKYWTQLIKMDTSGEVLWHKEYHAGESWAPKDIIQVADGYLVAVNLTRFYSDATAVFKTDFEGNVLWEKELPVTEINQFVRMQVISANRFKITIRSVSGFSPQPINPLLTDMVFDLQGNLIEKVSVENNNKFRYNAYSYSTASVADSSYAVTNQYWEPGPSGYTDVIVHFFDKNNKLKWEKIYFSGFPHNIAATSTGNYSVLCTAHSTSDKLRIFNTSKSNGGIVWQYDYNNYIYGSSPVAYASGIFLDKNDFHYVTGTIIGPYGSSGLGTTFILKVDRNGAYVWDFNFPEWFSQGDRIYVNDMKEIYIFGKRTMQTNPIGSHSLYLTKWKEL